MRYKVGAERTRRLQSRGIRPGRHLAPVGELVADGPTHAIDAETGNAACGFDVSRIVAVFDTDWETASLVTKCAACRAAVTDSD